MADNVPVVGNSLNIWSGTALGNSFRFFLFPVRPSIHTSSGLFHLQFITQHAIFTLEMSAALLCFELQTKYDMEIGFLDNKNNKTDIV